MLDKVFACVVVIILLSLAMNGLIRVIAMVSMPYERNSHRELLPQAGAGVPFPAINRENRQKMRGNIMKKSWKKASAIFMAKNLSRTCRRRRRQ